MRRTIVAALAAACLALPAAAPAADPLLAPRGKGFSGRVRRERALARAGDRDAVGAADACGRRSTTGASSPTGRSRLNRHPRSKAALRKALSHRRFSL